MNLLELHKEYRKVDLVIYKNNQLEEKFVNFIKEQFSGVYSNFLFYSILSRINEHFSNIN